MSELVLYQNQDGLARLTLNRPERHNALVPELLDALADALARAHGEAPRALLLDANGRSFSTGGDVAGFYHTPRELRRDYAHHVVGRLNDVILALLTLPCPTVVAVHGTVTGGSLGLVLGCDIAVAGPRANFAPWYTVVGYSPDGGWTALMPERIGRARALDIQLLNRQVSAEEAHRIGLVQHLVNEGEEHNQALALAQQLCRAQPSSVRHTLALTRPDPHRVRAALDDERQHFLEQIDSDEADSGMAAFLAR